MVVAEAAPAIAITTTHVNQYTRECLIKGGFS